MNILFLYRIYPSYGGVEVVTTLLANEFVKDGHKVAIASFESGNEGLLKQLDTQVQVLKLNMPVFSWRNVRSLRRFCDDLKIDIIVNQWGLPFYTSLLIKLARTNAQLVSVLHGSPVVARTLLQTQEKIKNATNAITRAFYKVILNFKRQTIKLGLRYNLYVNNKYILLSKSFIPVLEKFASVYNRKNLLAIGNPITIETDYSTHKEEKLNNILFVGRMDLPNKRVDRIIEFWERCHDKLEDWNLIMVGDGPYKPILEERAKALPRIQLEPFREEPPTDFYKQSNILLLTSDLEGFGLVVIEAMSYGLVPVVYGSYEAIYDIIDHDDNGFITSKPFDNKEFDEIVVNICNNYEKRCQMSMNAVEKSRIFSIESIKEQWYRVFYEVLEKE